ncbi:MAG: hypothetical protein PHD43_18285 [Methylococcales bacterium]|nr:hypothetical protein [Methylococcales bacterium]
MYVTPGLFQDWLLVREWSHIGLPGTARKDWFVIEEEAVTVGAGLC